MLNKFLFLIISFFTLSMQGHARQTIEVDFDRQPAEMASLKLPNKGGEAQWNRKPA